MELTNKVIVITGAGSGIGRAMAVAFGRAGARVVCCGRRVYLLKQTADSITSQGGTALALPLDVTRIDRVQATIAAVVKEFGRLDVLINNAASFGALGAAWEVDLSQWIQDIEVNLYGPLYLCRAVLPMMIKQKEGIIVNITAQAGTAAKPGCSAYACSKAALIHLTNTLASELSLKGLPVVVFGLDPGFNVTEMTEGLGKMAEVDLWLPGIKKSLQTASGTEPEQVAATAVDLVRFGAPILSGRTFRVGMTAQFIQEHAREIEENDLLTLRFRRI